MFLEVKGKRFSDARIIQKNESKHVSDDIECPVMAGREPNRKANELRETINRAILSIIEEGQMDEIRSKWFGREP